MKELIMGLFHNKEGAIEAILQGGEAEPGFAEAQEAKDAVINELLAKAAFKNAITEAGRLFEVKIPEETPDIDVLDIRTYPTEGDSSPKAVPREVEHGAALFQATTTAALVEYTEWDAALRSQGEGSSTAAD